MKLEELSKDELIYLIKKRYFFDLDDIEFDILSYRSSRCIQLSQQYMKRANDLLGDYIALLKPYDGKPVGIIPMNILKRANELIKQREYYIKKEQRKDAEYRVIQKRMNKILRLWQEEL